MRTIVVGVGNPALSDDGVGLHVARSVRELSKGVPGIEVEELWAGGLRIAEAIAGYDRAVIIDAMRSGDNPPGSVAFVPLSELHGMRTVACAHDVDLVTALEIFKRAGENIPEDIAVLGIETQDVFTLSENLTPHVSRAVGGAARMAFDAATRPDGAVR